MTACKECGELLTQDNRLKSGVSINGKQYYMARCKPCKSEGDSILYRLKKEHPMPPPGTPCQCCGRIDKLFYDHDHVTKTFRGMCCRTCNCGIGMLGDSEAGLRQALAYLERARPKSRSRSPIDNKTHDNDCGETESVKVAFGRSDNIQ